MQLFYNSLVHIGGAFAKTAAWFSPKMKQFVQGRKRVWDELAVLQNQKTLWFHCASLGEYEQGLPVMEALKAKYPDHKLLVTFFSPSGYENKKDNTLADVTTYLPLDTVANARRFVKTVQPRLAVFVKYEIWPNYLQALQQTPTLLIAALFREGQIYFKPYGRWMRKALRNFDHIFVQNEDSGNLLTKIGFANTSISGDTRYDRVSKQIETDNTLGFLEDFKQNDLCVIAGSTWPEDEALLTPYINQAGKGVKFVLAPHNLNLGQINRLQAQLVKKSVRYTEKEGVDLANQEVLILDTIGHLKKAYSYADVAYVGGGMGNSGLHNILEAATFGVPLVIGQNYERFPEAAALQSRAGLFSVSNPDELKTIFDKLLSEKNFREKTGMICGHFVQQNTGATERVMTWVQSHI